MSRGYICPIPGDILVGEGPTIVGGTVLAPEITGSAQQIGETPSITAGNEQSPTIVGAQADPVGPAPDAPSIAGGEALIPIIRDAEES